MKCFPLIVYQPITLKVCFGNRGFSRKSGGFVKALSRHGASTRANPIKRGVQLSSAGHKLYYHYEFAFAGILFEVLDAVERLGADDLFEFLG